mmetsp:Transcript_88232/g.250035  ORF Transcript_88232/g.250035 Transcript_88232/m.250035 type:complete len:204 (-) Transcript_88232:728-1339(-)
MRGRLGAAATDGRPCNARACSSFMLFALRSASSFRSLLLSSSKASASTSTNPVFTSALTSTHMARAANSSALKVSCVCAARQLTQTSRTVRQLPPIDPSRIFVSLLSRSGTCLCFSARALITLPRTSRLLLMWIASLKCRPSTPLFLTRSEPARSTTMRRARWHCIRWVPPSVCAADARPRRVSRIWKNAWLRLDTLFIFVSA